MINVYMKLIEYVNRHQIQQNYYWKLDQPNKLNNEE
jgi:hypothetical protein